MFLLWLILFLTPAFFAATFALYLVFFYSPNKNQNDDRRLARASQIPIRRAQILEMIDELAINCGRMHRIALMLSTKSRKKS